MHDVEPYCCGEICGICWASGENKSVLATHKVGEESQPANEIRHNWTQYVCCMHFQQIFRLGPDCWPERMAPIEQFANVAKR